MRPFVFVNVAASLDGKISDETRRQVRISSEEDMSRVDELRAKSDAVMVGIGTILSDDPSLTVKNEKLRARRILLGFQENPVRVVVDSRCRIPLNAKVLDQRAKTIVAVSKIADKEKVEEVRKKAEVIVCGDEKVDLRCLLAHLKNYGIKKLMVEGGGTLINSLLAEGLVDEFYIYYAPIMIGGEKAPTICDGRSFAEKVKFKIVSIEKFGEGFLVKAVPLVSR